MASVINQTNNTASVQTVEASTTTYIKLPKSAGYTKANVLKANTGKLGSVKSKLVKGSMVGMKQNTFSDSDSSDNRVVDVTKLSKSDKAEISRYALACINSARSQMGKRDGLTVLLLFILLML